MGLRRKIASVLSKKTFVQKAIAEKADLSAFKEKPSVRLVTGLFLIIFSFVICWPAVGVTALVAFHKGDPTIFLIGGFSFYLLSWAVWGLGMWLMGVENAKYGRILFRWFLRRMVEKWGEKELL